MTHAEPSAAAATVAEFLDPAPLADLLAGYCLDVQAEAEGRRALDRAGRPAAARAAAGDPRARRLADVRRRAAAARQPASSPTRGDLQLDYCRGPGADSGQAARRAAGHPGPARPARARRSRPGADRPRRPRAPSRARADAEAPLVLDAVADGGRRGAGGNVARAVRRLRAARDVPRPGRPGARVARPARLPGVADRAPRARPRAAHRGRRDGPDAARSKGASG